MKRLVLGLLLAVGRAFGAAGDIESLWVEPTGRAVYLYATGFSTNLVVDSGLGTNGTPTGNEKLTLLVDSPGFDTAGNSTTIRRTINGLRGVRIPTTSFIDTIAHGSGIRAFVSISEPIFAGDTISSVSVGSGLFSDGGTNSAAGTVTGITNSSNLAYPRPKAQHAESAQRIMTNGLLRTQAFGNRGDHGRPVAAVWNILTGVTSGHSVTSVSSGMRIIRDRTRGLPAAEWVTEPDMSGFTDNERVRIDTVVYPWIGDTNTVRDTRANEFTWPYHRLASITNIWDPDDDYNRLASIVATNGNDSTGQVFDRVAVDPLTITNFFLTAAGAANALQATNGILTARTNSGGATIYLRNGVVNWMGGTHTPNTVTPQETYLFVRSYPGETAEITTRLTSNDSGNYLWFDGVNFNLSASQVPINNLLSVVFRRMTLAGASTDAIMGTSHYQVWVDDCLVGPWAEGLKSGTSLQLGTYHVRNSDITLLNVEVVPTFFVGNTRIGTNGGTSIIFNIDRTSGFGLEDSIVFNNLIEGQETSSAMFNICRNTNYVDGVAVVQNVFVKTGNPLNGPLMTVASTLTNSNNGSILAYNNWINARCADLLTNNETFTNGFADRLNWLVQGNVWNGAVGWKLDTTPTPAAGKFTLNSFGCNCLHNWYGEGTTAEVGGNSFPPDHAGLWSYHPPVGTANTNLLDAFQWVYWPPWGAGGNGQYRLLSTAPGLRQNPRATRRPPWYLPFDLFGHPRSPFDPPGAVSVSAPRRGFTQ